MNENLVNKELKKYIEENIFKIYDLNGEAHGINHIKNVLERAFELADGNKQIDFNMLYTAVSYHDIGDHIDRENHEKVSAKWMMEDEELDKFFSYEQKEIIKEAIEDHRASNKNIPRNIYGKILSSADRNIDIDTYFYRSCRYGLEHYKDFTIEQQIERVYEHAIEKFGKNGYAVNKFYIKDEKYNNYLKELQELIENKEEFYKKTKKVFEEIM